MPEQANFINHHIDLAISEEQSPIITIMEYRPLNITVLSAKGIKDVNLFTKMNVYVEVSIAGYPKSTKSTSVDRDSGTHPKWNHRMEFIIDEPYVRKPGLFLLFNLKSYSSYHNDREIGLVTVPIHHLFHFDSYDEERVAKYEVTTAYGKAKGSFKFSYNFGEKFTESTKKQLNQPVVAPFYPKNKSLEEPVMAYPPQYHHHPPPVPHASYHAHPSGYGGYQPPPRGYEYPPPPAGYPPPGQKRKKKNNKMGMGMGLGAGLLGGLLLGEVASDVGDAAAYADGYGDAMGDMDGFDI